MRNLLSILQLFPPNMRESLMEEIQSLGCAPEEIRLRIGAPICLRYYGREQFFGDCLKKEQLVWIVGTAAEGSYHTAVRYLQMGYLPLRYGSRMGLCGNGTDGKIASFWDITSACIRISRAAVGCGDGVYNEIYGRGFNNTIIIAPPGAGKTTLLRELIRKLSYSGLYVGIADERGEIAGVFEDKPSYDLGPRTDVLNGIPKSQGTMMLLRSMTPNILAMDEITAHSDAEIVMEASDCGAGLLTTVHGDSVNVLRKTGFKKILHSGVFRFGIVIDVSEGERHYRVVDLYDKAVWRDSYLDGGCNARLFAACGDAETN